MGCLGPINLEEIGRTYTARDKRMNGVVRGHCAVILTHVA